MIRVYSTAIATRSFFASTIRAASGPIRYNPQVPASAKKPTRTTDDAAAAAAGVSHSRPRWKQRTSDVRKQEEQDDVETTDPSAELQRLKTELHLRDSSTHQKRENIFPVAAKKSSKSAELVYGDSRKFEENKPLQGSHGLFYGDGRKFEGLLTDSNLFEETVETEEDQKLAKEKQAAKNYALRLLGIAPQTAHKLRQKLIGRSVPEYVIESTIADLQRCGLQSDVEYAEAFVRSRWRSACWGPQRLKQELKLRGVGPEDVAIALEKVFTSTDDAIHEEEEDSDGDEEAEDEMVWGMTREARKHLLEKVRLQWARGGSQLSAEARKRRMVGWLQRRGFNWSITSQILKSLESQDQPTKFLD